jgi:triphosphatase
MRKGRELEIKIRLDAGEREKFAALDVLQSTRPQCTDLHTIYFDDNRGRLASHGLELRVRTEGGRHIQTIKSGAGLSRGEWESQIEGETPSRRTARGTPAKKYLRKKCRLGPIFEVRVDRKSWKVTRNGSTAEISIDTGDITSHGRHEKISEAEIELKGGSAELVFELAREVIQICGAPLSFVSKGLRGRRLEQGVSNRPEHDIDLRLDARSSAEEAFQRIIVACLQQVSINDEILRVYPDNVESVHQARIAIRRLRAALSMFERMIDGEDARRIKRELKWICELLGKARDLDVFLSGPIKTAELKHPNVVGIATLRALSEAIRTAAHRRLSKALHSQRFRQLLFALVLLNYSGEWKRDADGNRRGLRRRRFIDFASDELERRLRSIAKKKRASAITGADELKRHRVRINSKKLRYMAEFLKSLAPPKKFARTMSALKDIQTGLGVAHDAIAAEQIIAQVLRKDSGAELVFAAGVVRQIFAATTGSIEMACSAHTKLRHSKPFWRLF